MTSFARSRSPAITVIGLFIAIFIPAAMIAAAEFWDLWPRAAGVLGIQYNTLIVLVGTGLLGASAGLVGSFAVLRRQALMGDALAHAALPGICLAFLWRRSAICPCCLAGALATGLVGVATVAALRRWTRIKEDAAIGIVLSVFFGAGLALSRVIQNTTTTGSKAGLDSYILGKTAGMIAQDVTWIAGVSLASLLVVLLFYKEFKLVVLRFRLRQRTGLALAGARPGDDGPGGRDRRARPAGRGRGADGGAADSARRRGALLDRPPGADAGALGRVRRGDRRRRHGHQRDLRRLRSRD